jgi:hypothetical protein
MNADRDPLDALVRLLAEAYVDRLLAGTADAKKPAVPCRAKPRVEIKCRGKTRRIPRTRH